MPVKAPKTSRHLEVERKFDVVESTVSPSFEGIAAVAHVDKSPIESLDATYFDTPTQDLARNKITLRRRTGGHDAGWHLKLPSGPEARTEVRAPLDASDKDTVPSELRDVVLAIVRERPLDPRQGRPRLGTGVARVGGGPVGPGIRRPGDPALVADDDRAAVPGGRLPRRAAGDEPAAAHQPRAISAGPSAQAISAGHQRRVAPLGAGSARQPATTGSRARASRRAARSVVRGTIESSSRYSAGE